MKQSLSISISFVVVFILGAVIRAADTSGDILNENPATSDAKKQVEIANVSVAFLTAMEKVLDKSQLDPLLIKKIGAAYGQLSYISPATLPFFDDLIIELLKLGKLTYEDTKTPHFSYKFGAKRARNYVGLDAIKDIGKQNLSDLYHWNYPLYFNRLLGESKGDSLLIGGGENCECQHPENHAQGLFYRVDIDNEWHPDVVLHAGYLEHLRFFPTHRFGFIWFEHCTIGEMFQLQVFTQYFRFSKPGAVFLLQTNFIVPGYENPVRSYFQALKELFIQTKFVILEHKEGLRRDSKDSRTYDQWIVMKPFLKNLEQKIDPSPLAPIELNDYVPASQAVQATGLFRALLLSNQLDRVKELLHSASN